MRYAIMCYGSVIFSYLCLLALLVLLFPFLLCSLLVSCTVVLLADFCCDGVFWTDCALL